MEVIDVTASEQAYKDMNSRTGKSSVPQIFLIWKGQQPVEEYIGGCASSSSSSSAQSRARAAGEAGEREIELPC